MRLCLLLIALIPLPAWAVTLNDSYRAALVRSEVVATQGELLTQQEELFKQAKGGLLPTVAAVGQDFWQQTPPGGATAGSPSVQPLAKITAQQPLFRGFREFAGIREEHALVDSQDLAWKAAAVQLYKDVATSFYSVVASEKDLANLREEIGLYEARVKDLMRWVKIGRSRMTEVLTVQSARAALVAQAEQVKGQIAVQRALFSYLTGLHGSFILQDIDEVPSTSIEIEPYLGAIGARPDVKSAERASVAAEEGIWVAKGAHLPSADLFGNYYLYRNGSLSNVDWDVQLVVSLPIFQGGIIQSRVRQAESQRIQADLATSRARRQAEQEVTQDFAQFSSDRRQLRAFADALDLARRNYESLTVEYRHGLATNLDVLTALTSFEESQRSLDRARAAVKLDFAALEASVAKRPRLDEPK
jgi:outer membrane protein